MNLYANEFWFLPFIKLKCFWERNRPSRTWVSEIVTLDWLCLSPCCLYAFLPVCLSIVENKAEWCKIENEKCKPVVIEEEEGKWKRKSWRVGKDKIKWILGIPLWVRAEKNLSWFITCLSSAWEPVCFVYVKGKLHSKDWIKTPNSSSIPPALNQSNSVSFDRFMLCKQQQNRDQVFEVIWGYIYANTMRSLEWFWILLYRESAHFLMLLFTRQEFFAVVLPALLWLYSKSNGNSETRGDGSIMCINVFLVLWFMCMFFSF